MGDAKAISDEDLADVVDLVAARRPIPAIIVEAILKRLRVAEAGGRAADHELNVAAQGIAPGLCCRCQD